MCKTYSALIIQICLPDEIKSTYRKRSPGMLILLFCTFGKSSGHYLENRSQGLFYLAQLFLRVKIYTFVQNYSSLFNEKFHMGRFCNTQLDVSFDGVHVSHAQKHTYKVNYFQYCLYLLSVFAFSIQNVIFT
jgi:hypothetical protein